MSKNVGIRFAELSRLAGFVRSEPWVEMGVNSAAYEQSHSRELSAVSFQFVVLLSASLLWGALAVAIAMRWNFTNVPTDVVMFAVFPAFLMVTVPIDFWRASI